MENAKHTGYLWALAVAAGVGLAIVNTPAVALAAPGDNGKGSSGDSSSASASHASNASASNGSKHSSDTPGAKRSSSATNDGPRRHRPAPKQGDEAASSSDAAQTPATPTTERSNKHAVQTLGLDAAGPNVHKPAGVTVHRGSDPALSPFASSAPTDPVQAPAGLMMLAFTRRESDQRASTPTNGQVTTSAVDPDFISSTHDFGLFSVTSAADPDDNQYVAFVLSTPLFTNVLTSGTDPEDNLGFGTASIGVAGHTVNTFISPFFTFSVGIPITDPFAALFTELVRQGF